MPEHVELPLQVRMPTGSDLIVRRAVPEDAAALEALYGRLDADDRYCRFFTGAGTSPAFVERWLTGPGNEVVVAMLDGEAVAEAGYAVDDQGRCQLGITVDRAHRGWLGPFLLDLVLARAAEHGHAAVAADVLATNRPMRALVASRGHAVLPTDDLSVVRVLLGTADAVPGWDGTGARRRALVELGHAGSGAVRALAAAGYDVVACPGPARSRSRHWRCPALAGGTCPLVAGADVVVAVGAADPDPADAALLDAVRAAHPGVALCRLDRHASPEEVVAAADGAEPRGPVP